MLQKIQATLPLIKKTKKQNKGPKIEKLIMKDSNQAMKPRSAIMIYTYNSYDKISC